VKQLVILVAVVIVLVGAWLIVRGVSKPSATETGTGFAVLETPADPTDKPALIRSAHQLWNASSGRYEASRVDGLIRLLHDALDDQEWRAVSAGVTYAWLGLRQVVAYRAKLSQLNERLLDRIVRVGSMSELEDLIRVANNNSFDAERIDQALNGSFLPGGRVRSMELVTAAVRFGDWNRARAWLDRLSSHPEATEDDAAFAARMGSVVDVGRMAAVDRKYDLPALIAAWAWIDGDPVVARWTRSVLLGIGMKALHADPEKRGGWKDPELLSRTAGMAGARSFWDKVIARLQLEVAKDIYADIPRLEALAKTYGGEYGMPDFAARVWLRVTELGAERWWGNSLWVVEHLKRALATVNDEALKTVIIQRMVDQFLEAREYGRAREFVDRIVKEIKGEANLKTLEPLIADVRQKDDADKARVAKEKQIHERQRLQGQLKYMQEQIERARRQGRTPADILSMENVKQELEKKLTE
jgi:hypothetical protein